MTGDESRVFPFPQAEDDQVAKDREGDASREDSLVAINSRLRQFRTERNWERFHTPRSLAVSIGVEAGELLEQFQWVSDDEIEGHIEARRSEIQEEVADVAIYAVQLADVLGISLADAIHDKIELNESRYPVEAARSSSAKYTELADDDPIAGVGG